MLPNLQHYVTAALIQQMQLILAGTTSATGNPLTVPVFRASPATLPGPPPHIWVRAEAAGSPDELAILGSAVGQDSGGNQLYGAVLWGPLVTFGVRCQSAPERDDLFDILYRAFAGSGINPATGNRWIYDINVNVGIVVADVTGERTMDDVETTQYGALFEATASLVVTTVASESVSQAAIESVDINPVTVTIAVPVN